MADPDYWPPLSQLVNISALPAPPGEIALDPNASWARANTLFAVGTVMITLSAFFVYGRLYINYRAPGRRLGYDDLFAVLGWIFNTAFVILQIWNRRLISFHLWDVPLSALTPDFFKMNVASTVILGPSGFFPRASILLLYLRIFKPNKKFRYIIYAVIAFVFAIYFSSMFPFMVFCSPPLGEPWNPITTLRCGKTVVTSVVFGPLIILIDIFIFVAPVLEVIKLNLSMKKKILTSIVFLTACLATVSSIVGLAFRVTYWKDFTLSDWSDAWTSTICIILENYICLIVGSAPAFASFSIQKIRGKGVLANFRRRYIPQLQATKVFQSFHARIPKRRTQYDSDTILHTQGATDKSQGTEIDSVTQHDLEKGDSAEPRIHNVDTSS